VFICTVCRAVRIVTFYICVINTHDGLNTSNFSHANLLILLTKVTHLGDSCVGLYTEITVLQNSFLLFLVF
jgi:hypothetical protein